MKKIKPIEIKNPMFNEQHVLEDVVQMISSYMVKWWASFKFILYNYRYSICYSILKIIK